MSDLAERAKVVAAKLRDASDARSAALSAGNVRMPGLPSCTLRDAGADALSELADIVEALLNQPKDR